jgi:hypothetical protein
MRVKKHLNNKLKYSFGDMILVVYVQAAAVVQRRRGFKPRRRFSATPSVCGRMKALFFEKQI